MKPKQHLFGLSLLVSVYIVLMSYHYYDTKQIFLRSIQDNVENLLLYNRAISSFIAHTQRPEVEKLCQTQKNEMFSPALQSSSYITRKINEYVNIERKQIYQFYILNGLPLIRSILIIKPMQLNTC